jgi:hypothetical protein
MNYESLIPLLITTFVAVTGWYIAHRLSANRERDAKRREMRVQYLFNAWRKLENSSNRQDNTYANELESAIADIQLLGTNKQIILAQEFSTEFATKKIGDLDKLLDDLRTDLRKELRLDMTSTNIKHLRILKDPDKI